MKANFGRSLGAFCLLCLFNWAYAGVVIPIDAPGKAFLANKDATSTKLFPTEKPAVATLLLIPGGDGQIPPMKDGPSTSPWFNGIFGPLFNSTVNVVVVSNPYPMEVSQHAGGDHLDRMETVVRFYKEKMKVPVYLFGHSNGAAAVMEFLNRSAENRQLVAGIVLSSARHEYHLNSEVKLPVLIMHHKDDECVNTSYRSAVSRFEKLKKVDAAPVTLATIEGGTGGGDPCHFGHHMYINAYPQVADALVKYFAK